MVNWMVCHTCNAAVFWVSAINNQWLSAHTLRKKEEIKIVSVLTRLPSSLVPWHNLNWRNGQGGENIFGVDCWVGCTWREGGEKKGILVEIVRIILWTSKGGIGRWNLTEVEEQFLVEIVALVVCTSRVVKMKEHLPFCREFSILCIEDRVVADHVI